MTKKIDFQHCDSHSEQLGESSDCVVYACAIATQIDYPTMHEYIAETCDRKKGHGVKQYKYHRALSQLGVTLVLQRGPSLNWVEHSVEGHYKRIDDWGSECWVNGHWRRRLVVADKDDDECDYSGRTIGTVSKQLSTGVYLIRTEGHVFAMIDGTVYDHGGTTSRRIVHDVYRVKTTLPKPFKIR
jgi:hypothetical protein